MNGDLRARLARHVGNGRDKLSGDEAVPPSRGAWSSDELLGHDAHRPATTEDLYNGNRGELGPASLAPSSDEVAQLRAENEDLQRGVLELRQILDDMKKQEEGFARREREYESLLEEKSEVIRELHRKLQESAPAGSERAAAAAGPVPREEELLALHEELERERRQLQQDEEALMQQMRNMELQMSRERAELARQRNELQRLQTEIRHELELAARDATLRERLAPLQRRAQDAFNRRGSPTMMEIPAPAEGEESTPAANETRGRKDSSGLLRRLFG